MNTVFVMVVHVVSDQPAQMLFIKRDDMVQDLPPATSDPAFGDTVLPGGLRARWLGLQTRCLQERHDVGVEFRIPIEDRVTIWAGFRKCLAQLLHDPLRGRVTSNVEMQNSASPMLDNEKAIEHLEGHRWHGEEVKCHNHLAVILEKGKPALARVTAALYPAQVTSYASFRDNEAEFQELAMDLRRSPFRILVGQSPHQTTDLLGDLRPTTARARAPAPVEPKTGAMPADNGAGLDYHQDFGPARPAPAQQGPKQPIQRA